MENNIEFRTKSGVSGISWLTIGAAPSSPNEDAFNATFECHSSANPCKEQLGCFSKDLFDGMVKEFGKEFKNNDQSRSPQASRNGIEAKTDSDCIPSHNSDYLQAHDSSVSTMTLNQVMYNVPAAFVGQRQEKAAITYQSSEVNGVNLDSLGARIKKAGKYAGYEKTDYGYIQADSTQPGPDFLLLIEDPKKMTDQQKHYMRNIELAQLIREGKIPTHLDEFMDSESDNYRLLPEGASRYHMNGENGGYNIKLVNDKNLYGYKKGELEVVYSTVTGKLDLSAENMPTINRAGPDKKWEHFEEDMVPYFSYKNTPNDSTGWLKRRTGPFWVDQSDADKKAVYDIDRESLAEKQP